jgi:Zn-dependent metalloprotease
MPENGLKTFAVHSSDEWVGTQMIYGQRMVNGALRSYALASDVVAHEITHGLTDRTARLEYQRETGALNESYSDILGVIIANRHRPSFDDWNWEVGEDLDLTGVPNKAAFNLMASRNAAGGRLFTPREAAALFYVALTQYLSRTSGFSDSRRGVELAARTLFRDDEPATKARKLATVATAFNDVGITA